MTDQNTSHAVGTAEEEQKKIVDTKAKLGETQDKTIENRAENDKAMPDQATTINRDREEPIDPAMSRIPPA